MTATGEYKLLFAKADDLYARARKGEVAYSGFLNPAEAHYLEKHLKENRIADTVLFWGGCVGAMRKRAFFLPDYILDLVSGEVEGERDKLILTYIADDVASALAAVRVKGSGYRALSHRDYLGSILSLGLERHVMGDIAIMGECEAIIFADAKIAEFLLQTLSKVANDDVKCAIEHIADDFTVPENVEDMVISVASRRLDCLVASLANSSREEAQRMVRSGAVSVDYEEMGDPDKKLENEVLLAIRGHGKFRVLEGETLTRRERLRIKVQKFI